MLTEHPHAVLSRNTHELDGAPFGGVVGVHCAVATATDPRVHPRHPTMAARQSAPASRLGFGRHRYGQRSPISGLYLVTPVSSSTIRARTV